MISILLDMKKFHNIFDAIKRNIVCDKKLSDNLDAINRNILIIKFLDLDF